MPKRKPARDLNADVVAHILAATGSEPVDGESLLDSPELRKQFREAKEKEAKRVGSRTGSNN